MTIYCLEAKSITETHFVTKFVRVSTFLRVSSFQLISLKINTINRAESHQISILPHQKAINNGVFARIPQTLTGVLQVMLPIFSDKNVTNGFVAIKFQSFNFSVDCCRGVHDHGFSSLF